MTEQHAGGGTPDPTPGGPPPDAAPSGFSYPSADEPARASTPTYSLPAFGGTSDDAYLRPAAAGDPTASSRSPSSPDGLEPPTREYGAPSGPPPGPYGGPAPPYGASAPPYGASAPPYGASAPPYGASAPPSGGPAPSYGSVPPSYEPPPYGPPQPAFGPQAAPPGGYGAGGYGVDPFGMPVPTKVDTLANVAMGVGIGAAAVGVFGCCCGPLGIVALLGGVAGLVLGFVSRRNINAAGGQLAGRGQSLAGIITGATGIVLGIGWIALTIVGFSGALTG